jgi:L-lactate permease
LIATASGLSGVWEIWPAVLTCGLAFAGVQFVVSNFVGAQLTDILSSLSAIVALVVLFRFWHPRRILRACDFSEGGATGKVDRPVSGNAFSISATYAGVVTAPVLEEKASLSATAIFMAWSPYLLLVLFVLFWGLKPNVT